MTPTPAVGWPVGSLAAFDTETTGVDVDEDRLLSAALIRIEPGQAADVRSWLADPGIDIPEQATAVHGIHTEYIRAWGQPAAEAIEDITTAVAEQLAAGVPLVVFNARFDLTLLDREARRHDLVPLVDRLPDGALAPVIDPLVLDKQMQRYRRGKRTLPALCEHYRIQHEEAHNATSDALAAARLAWRLGTANPDLGAMAPDELHQRQIIWAAEQAASLQSYLRRSNPAAAVDPAWPYTPASTSTPAKETTR